METKRMSDAQIEYALRNVRRIINEDCDGYFDARAIAEVIEHCPLSGPALLRQMARVSLPILPTADAERIIKNREKALHLYVTLQNLIGEQRLLAHLSRQSSFYMDLAQAHLLKAGF